MSGRPPLQALKEAKVIARRQGDLCENMLGRGILYDFAIHLALAIIKVRIKRTRWELETIEEVMTICARDIARLRNIPQTSGLIRELWVRGPSGRWRFYLVRSDQIMEIPPGAMPEAMKAVRPVREDAPGPDRPQVLPEAAARPGKYFCPFMAVSRE
jgi:hypothetical protein